MEILQNEKLKFGSVAKKILLLLKGGLVLSLTQRPDNYFRIVKGITKEWQTINKRTLHESIKRLYQSKMIDYKENEDGTIALILSDEGKRRALCYNLETLKIK